MCLGVGHITYLKDCPSLDHVGGRVCLDRTPPEALDLALRTAGSCRWDDVGIDICQHEGNFYVLEANMKYGKEGFRQAGINYIALMEAMIENEEI